MNHLRITYESPIDDSKKQPPRVVLRTATGSPIEQSSSPPQGEEKAPRPPKGGEKGGRGNADWQSAQYKESNGGKNATEGNKEDGRAASEFNSDAINKVKKHHKQSNRTQ